MFALQGELGFANRESRLRQVSDAIGREIESSNDLTLDELSIVLDVLGRMKEQK